MIETVARDRAAVATVLRALLVLAAATRNVAAALHLGSQLPLGPFVLAEPSILPAAIVEGLCGLFLALSAHAVFTGRRWARGAAVGAGPPTELNDVYQRVTLVALLAGLGLLATPETQAALRRERSQDIISVMS